MWIDHRYHMTSAISDRDDTRIFSVHDALLNVPRALKGVYAHPMSPEARRIEDEWEVLSRIRHPRIVRAFDLGWTCLPRDLARTDEDVPEAEDSGEPFIYFSMEMIGGPDLRSLQHTSLTHKLRHFAQLLEATAAVHRHGILCGDLKPENALIGPDGVVLIDFGLSSALEDPPQTTTPTGTLPYMAPEVLGSQQPDARSDLFSLGVILFELLTGTHPFPEAQTLTVRLARLKSAPRQPDHWLQDDVRSQLHPSLLQLLDGLLALDPGTRPTDAVQALHLLEPVLMALDLPFDMQPDALLPEFPLEDREQDLDHLVQAFEAVDPREGGLLQLEGPEGVGKSRLLCTLQARLLHSGQNLVLRLQDDGLPPDARQGLITWLNGAYAAHEAPPWIRQLESRRLEALAGQGPLPALLLDQISLPFHPASGLASIPGLWICQTLQSPSQPQHQSQRPVSDLRPLRDLPPPGHGTPPTPTQTFTLDGLSEKGVRTLVERASTLVRAPQTITRFHQFSEGNPGLLRAVLLHPDEMTEPGPILARQLTLLVGRDLEGLNPDARQVARHAALLGDPFHSEVLAGLVGRMPAQLSAALTLLLDRRLLLREADGAALQFRRPLVRALLVAELEPEQRVTLHRKAGELLERRLQLGGQVHNRQLALHFDRSDDQERARRYLGRALREALRNDALLDANEQCQRLLARVSEAEVERTKLLLQLGDINTQLQRFPPAESAYEAALQRLDAEPESDPMVSELQLEVLSKLARALEHRGDFQHARQRLERARALGRLLREQGFVPTSSQDLASLTVALARVLHRDGQPEKARELLQEAIPALDQPTKAGDRMEALILQGLIELDLGALEHAETSLQQALQLAQAPEWEEARMRALHNLHMLHARRGNLPAAIDFLQQALSLAEKRGDVARLGAGHNNLGNLQKRMGDHRRALKSYRKAIRTFQRVGDRAGLVTAYYSQAELLRERGELVPALDLLQKAEALAEKLGGGFQSQALRRLRLVRGEIYLATNQLEQAAPLLEASRAAAEAQGDQEALRLSELGLVELQLAQGDVAGAEKRCADLGRREGGDRVDEAASRILSRLHHQLGRHHAGRYLERARIMGPERHAIASLETVRALLPEGPAPVKSAIETAIHHLEHAGRQELVTNARRLLLGFGASAQERLTLLEGVIDLLQHLGDRRRVLENLVSLATKVLRAERGLLLRCKTDGAQLEYSALHGIQLGEAQRVSKEIIRRVAATGKPVIVADALDDPSLIGSASIHDLQIRSVLGLKVSEDEHGLWILYLDHRQLSGVFTQASSPMLERLSQLTSGLLREIRWRELMAARVQAQEADTKRHGMVGTSHAIQRVREYIDNLGHLKLHNENLLFIGESGTGKELVARAVHKVVRGDNEIPFIAQSCADIPTELMESTLFGHRHGAFTGAREDRPGIFELANNGVLFLDEIGELPLGLQATLLRVLEERVVSRVGEPEKSHTLSLIVVCATNRDLSKEVEAGRFRRDLYHRLNQVFVLPPLRQRREDILPLLKHFMAQIEDFSDRSVEEVFVPEVLLWFHEHPWPGNVRELKNMVEAIPVRIKAGRQELVQLEDIGIGLHPSTEDARDGADPRSPAEDLPLKEYTDRIESSYIRRTMDRSDWDITRAAARLGLTYQGLRKRLIRYDWMKDVERRRRS